MSRLIGPAALVAAALAGGSCGGSGPTAPTGTDLSGRWRTGEMVYTASGRRVGVYFEFIVNAASTEVVELVMRATNVPSDVKVFVGASGRIPSVSITNNSFQIDGTGNTCDGVTGSYSFSATFNSSTSARGDWRDTNTGPPGYIFCGSNSFDWTATRVDGAGPTTGLSQPGIAVVQVTPSAGGTVSIGSCAGSTTTCTTSVKVSVDVVAAQHVPSPIIAFDFLRADGQRCASTITTRSSPSGPIVTELLPNVRANYSIEFLSFDKPAGSQTPSCVPPFTTTTMRVHLHPNGFIANNPAVLDQTFDLAYNWVN